MHSKKQVITKKNENYEESIFVGCRGGHDDRM